MHKAVYDFNQSRNNFELDMDLEIRMLKEEVQEFFAAKSLAERIDAIIDVDYVWQGTKMKCLNDMTLPAASLVEFIDKFLKMAMAIVIKELPSGITIDEAMVFAGKTVVRCNAAKGTTKDADGKINKENFGLDATAEIQAWLDGK